MIEFYSTPQKDPFIGGKTIQSGSGSDIVTDLSAQTTLTRGFRTVNSVDLGEGNDQLHLNYNTSNFIITLGGGADTIVQQARQDPDDVVGLRIIKDFNPAQDTIELPDTATGAMIYELVSTEAGTMLKSAGDNPTDILLLEGVALDEVQMKGGIISGQGVEDPGEDCDTDGADAVTGEENAPWYNESEDAPWHGEGEAPETMAEGENEDAPWHGADDDQDVIMGSEGDDELCGSESDEQIFGGDGDDSLFGSGSDTEDECQPSGNDSLHGENGNDYLAAGDGDDYLFGDAGDDILHGGKGDDNLCGGDGNDDLIGHQGSDIIVGGPGNDFFAAGLGDDVIVTGEGSDYYLLQSDGYGTSYGNDIITDFDTGNDLVIIEDDTLHGDNIADCFREIGEGLLVETGNSSVLLQGICADDVDIASNFAF